MKNRILSIILTLLMVVSVVSVFTLPAAAATGFEIEPVVLIGGDGMYNIVWKSNSATQGRIEYTYAGKKYTVYDEENGVVRPADKYHSIRVPQEHIDSLYEGNNKGSAATFTLYSGNNIFVVKNFDGYRGESSVNVGFLSDIHYSYTYAQEHPNAGQLDTVIKNVKARIKDMGHPQIRALVGDVTDSLATQGDLDALLKILSAAGQDGAGSAGHYPVLYAIGNHEKRGVYLHDIDKYLSFSTGEMYGYFDFGPMSVFVTDIGEDKIDNHSSYTASATDPIGTIDMERYNREQYEYFKSHNGFNPNATYTYTIGHGPSYIGYGYSSASSGSFTNLFNSYGNDLHIFGHIHNIAYYDGQGGWGSADSTKDNAYFTAPFPGVNIASLGKYNANEQSVLLTLQNKQYKFEAYDTSGKKISNWSYTVNADANGRPTVKEEVEEVLPSEEDTGYTPPESTTVPTVAGVSTGEIKSAASTMAITTKPVVFDTGLHYNVVWSTSSASAGYVEVSDNSKTYMDQYGGVIRGYSTIHSVRIPKADLDGKSYMIKNRSITHYNGHGYGAADPDTGVFENYSDPLKFGAYSYGGVFPLVKQPTSADDEYRVLAIGNKANYLTENDAKAVAASYGDTPHLVVFTGSNVSAFNTEANFVTFLNYAYTLTGGKTPVMLLRGKGESTGNYAASVPNIIHNMSSAYTVNKMYTTSKSGVLSVIGLDSADNTAGSTPFVTIREQQSDWLANDLTSTFAGNYNLAFSDEPYNMFSSNFAKHKVQLYVTSDNGDATSFSSNGSSFARAIVGTTGALAITCNDNKIVVKSVSGSGMTTLGTVDVGKITYASARVGNKYYSSLEEAMSAAKSGETVTLEANSTTDMLVVRPGRTLDLNGYKLTASLVNGFNGSDVIDSSANKTGRLVAAKDNVSLATANSQMPVYDSANNSFVFVKMAFSTKFNQDKEYVALTAFGSNTVERTVPHQLLSANSVNAGIDVIVRLSWPNDSYAGDQNYKFTAEQIKTIVDSYVPNTATGKGSFDKNFKALFGTNDLGQDMIESGDIQVCTVVRSSTGVEAVSNLTPIAIS